DYIRELKLLAHHLQERHKEDLEKLEDPILLLVELPTKVWVYFLIGPEGIVYKQEAPNIKNKILVSYRDLMRLVEKPSKALRYLFEGRIKLQGDYHKILGALQKLL
ncbi:MAG: SCP2 sterol-binding domain-containing protein, partial [Aquificaceae bacterium]